MKTSNLNPRVARMFLSEQEKTKEITNSVEFTDARDVLIEAKECFEGLREARNKRRRHIRYAFGEKNGQWSDIMEGTSSKIEAEHISDQGKTPLQYNMILSSIQTIMGQYASVRNKPICTARDRDEQKLGEMITVAIEAAYSSNQLNSMDIENMLETLIAGISIGKVRYGFNPATQTTGIITENKNLTRMFFNQMEDPRNWDCYIIGEIHDMRMAEVYSNFGQGSRQRMNELHQIYSNCTRDKLGYQWGTLTNNRKELYDFLTPYDPHFCRVIEIWKLESALQYKCHDRLTGEYYWTPLNQGTNIARENKMRSEQASGFGIKPRLIEFTEEIHQYWYYRFMSPSGLVLKEGESPYWHGSHPYALRRYMGVDGAAHSFVEMMIDPQRMLNRNITLMDFILGSSSKGTLMVPEGMLKDTTLDEITCEYRKVGGVIVYKPDNSPNGGVPTEVSSRSSNVGVSEMVGLIRSLLPDLSGVHGALQGKQANSGTSGKLYQAEAEQAATNLVYIFETFKDYRVERDKKMMQLIQQYYEEPVYIGIVGKDYSEEAKMYNPKMVRNTDFDLAMSESANNGTLRQLANDYLFEMFKLGAITAENFLSNSAMPFADKVLQSIQSDRREAEQAQAALQQQGGVHPIQIQQPTA